MLDFIKQIINNNDLMILLMFIFVFSVSILAFSEIRKVIIGSVVSSVVSITIALLFELSSIGDFLGLVLRNAKIMLYNRTSIQTLSLVHGDIIAGLNNIDNEYLFVDYEYFDSFYQVLKSSKIISFFKSIRNSFEVKFNHIKNEVLHFVRISKPMISIRI